MGNNSNYRFTRGKDGYILFDSEGYILEAKGFGGLMWTTNHNVDKDLVGKHVDELAEMLEKHGTSREVYLEFEATVHIGLLKEMLKNSNQ